MESEESACLLIVGFWFVPFLRNNWGGLKETRVATADVVWSKGTGTSASDLMCGPIKAHATGAITVCLSVSVGCVCLSRSRLTLSHCHIFFFFWITFFSCCVVNVNTSLCITSRRERERERHTLRKRERERERAGVVKSLICTSRNSHKSPVPRPPPLSTSHTIPRSTELSIWGASGLLWQHMVIHSRCPETLVLNTFPINNRVRGLFNQSGYYAEEATKLSASVE